MIFLLFPELCYQGNNPELHHQGAQVYDLGRIDSASESSTWLLGCLCRSYGRDGMVEHAKTNHVRDVIRQLRIDLTHSFHRRSSEGEARANMGPLSVVVRVVRPSRDFGDNLVGVG